jgi:predicted dehydrogenase
MEKVKAAIIGAGNISGIYSNNLLNLFSDTIELCTIADGILEKAKTAVEQYGLDSAKLSVRCLDAMIFPS